MKISKILGLTVSVIIFVVIMTHEVSPAFHEVATSDNFAWGQTGPTGPTGATGATGPNSVTYNNHTIFTGSAPTVSDCGTGASVVSGSNDNAGQVIIGTNADGSARKNCQLTFATAFTHAPAVSFSVTTNGVSVSPILVSTTVLRVIFINDPAGGTLSYSAF